MLHPMDHAGHNARPLQTDAPHSGSLREVLKRRYALGEINREQFEDMKRVLGIADSPHAVTAHEAHPHHEPKE